MRIIPDFARFLAGSWHHRAEVPSGTKVGSTGAVRSHQLTQELPTSPCRPPNIMVGPRSSWLTILVDWTGTEVEVLLPLGLCLYGLEELLGCVTSMGWTYCDRSECLRV